PRAPPPARRLATRRGRSGDDGWRMSCREARALLRTPLCPAGHLPHKGGDWQFRRRRLHGNVNDWRKPCGRLISPLVGEMSGRTEGGNVERHHHNLTIDLIRSAVYPPVSALSRSMVISTRSGVAGASRRGQIVWPA